MRARRGAIAIVLLGAILGVSLSGPLVRLSHAPAVAIAAWRMVFSVAIVAVPLLWSGSWRQLRSLSSADVGFAITGGVALALHFWAWNTSVVLTTIAASVVLVNTQPLMVAGLSALWLREAPSRQQWLGIAVAMAGAAVVAIPDMLGQGFALDGRAALGDALALIGAVMATIYYVIGRRLRTTLSLWPYVAVVYSACLVALLAIAAARRVPLTGFPLREYAIFAGLALGPMLLGHTALNWALRYARAYQVNLVLLGEPIGATLLAATLPGIHERPGLLTLVGGAVVLGGILLAEWKRGT